MCFWPCCCNCHWLNDDWPDISTGLYIFDWRVTSHSESVTLISDDGTPMKCRKNSAETEVNLTANQTPCIEVVLNFECDTSSSDTSYTSGCIYGQTFSDFSFSPDGDSHTIKASIDASMQYYYVRNRLGAAGVTGETIYDAAVPTSHIQFPHLMLLAKQGSDYFLWSIPSTGSPDYFNGDTGTRTTSGSTGTWHRRSTLHVADEIQDLDDATYWFKIDGTVSSTSFPRPSLSPPDFSAGSDTIEFGWAVQILPAMQNFSGDFRCEEFQTTTRIDRLCISID